MRQIKRTTNVFILRDQAVCLGMKKRGHGEGKYNGFGGKVKEGEDWAIGAARELEEETTIKVIPNALRLTAEVWFYDPTIEWHMRAYICTNLNQEPAETEEMRPEWFPIDRLPYTRMWSTDSLWLPQVLKGKEVKLKLWFDEQAKLVKSKTVFTKLA